MSPATEHAAVAFEYRTLSRDGRTQHGVVLAPDASAAAATVVSDGSLLVKLAPASGTRRPRRLSSRASADGYRLLALLLESGLPLHQALGAMQEVAPREWPRDRLATASNRVGSGASLAEALATASLAATPRALRLVAASEASGDTAHGLRAAADQLAEEDEFRASLRDALAYPCVIMAASCLTALVLVVVVLPRFTDVLEQLGSTPPGAARALIGAVHAVQATWLPVLTGTILVLLLGSHVLRTRPDALLELQSRLLSLPVVGNLLRDLVGGRACQLIAGCLDSGQTLPVALRAGAEGAGLALASLRIEQLLREVVNGERVSAAADRLAILPSGAGALLRAGETTGQLSRQFRLVGDIAIDRARRRISWAVRVLEPTLILALGAWVAFIAIALLQSVSAVGPVL